MSPEAEHDTRAVRLAAGLGRANMRLDRVRAVLTSSAHDLAFPRVASITRQPCACWKSRMGDALDGPLS